MEIYVPRITVMVEGVRQIIVLECGCGYAMPYPGVRDTPEALQCDRCGTTWRSVSFEQLAELGELNGGRR